MFYVYVYNDPRTSPPTPIYVGKGSRGRYLSHLSRPSNPILSARLKRIKKEGLLDRLYISVQYCDSEREAFELERQLVTQFGRIDLGTGPLANLTEGGDGCNVPREYKRDYMRRPEVREKIGKIAANRSEESLKKMSDAKLGKTWTDARRKALEQNGNPLKGRNRVLTDEWKKNIGEAGKGRVPWNKGKTKSDEPRLKGGRTKASV